MFLGVRFLHWHLFLLCTPSGKYSLTCLRSCIPFGIMTKQFFFKARNSQLFMLIYLPAQTIVSKNALQYRGNSQHDAQEFLLWLLDRVHEDLNHSVKQSGQPPLKVRTHASLGQSASHESVQILLLRTCCIALIQ